MNITSAKSESFKSIWGYSFDESKIITPSFTSVLSDTHAQKRSATIANKYFAISVLS